MHNLSDRERELMLWLICDGWGVNEISKEARHHDNTLRRFVDLFSWWATMGGWKVAEKHQDLDQFITRKSLPLNGRDRAPMAVRTSFPILKTRAIVATARDMERGQQLVDNVFPLIKAAYWPDKRQAMLQVEARKEGALAPPHCRHCAGTYGWKRHDEICVRFNLS